MRQAPKQAERAAEVVQDEVHALDPQLERALQELRIGRDVAVERARLVRFAEAGHVERDRPAELPGPVHERRPVAARSRVAVHEHDRLLGVLGARFDQR